MSSDKKVKIGLIGCGSRLTNVIRRMLDTTDQVEVVAFCDPSETAIKKSMERLKSTDAKVYENHLELSSDPNVEWVCVGSWNCFHKEHILGALENNKHVFTEKPLTTNIDDCAILKTAIDKHEGMFSMGFVLRYSAFYRRIRELVQGGHIGKLVSFEFNETLNPDHGGFIAMDWRRKREWAGTHLLEKCCHDFDLANWITDSVPVRAASFGDLDFFKPENAKRMNEVGPHENGLPAYCGWRKYSTYVEENTHDPFNSDKDIIDNQVAILQYASGVKATFHTNLNTAIQERRMYLCGTEGTIRGDVLNGKIEYKRYNHEPVTMVEQSASGGHGGADGTMSSSLGKSMTEGADPLVGLEDGIRAAVACFGVDEALDTSTVYDMATMWDKVGLKPA